MNLVDKWSKHTELRLRLLQEARDRLAQTKRDVATAQAHLEDAVARLEQMEVINRFHDSFLAGKKR
jgi:hypothetical protein